MALSSNGYNGGGYAQQASDAQYRYNTDKAANTYGRFLSKQRGERSLGDMSQSFNRSLPKFGASFGQRGLAGPGASSGVQTRAYGNYLGDFSRDYTRTQTDLQAELGNYDRESAGLDANLNNSLAAIEAQRQEDIANAALSIEALRPLLGGL
jgi:hypothetical protein